MNSTKDNILSKIKAISRAIKPLPIIPYFENEGDLKMRFSESIQINKGEMLTEDELQKLLESGHFPNVYSQVEDFKKYSNINFPEDPHDLSGLDLAIVKGQFGVAENGAIWLEDLELGHRALPFITEHLVIILEEKNLFQNMHAAYRKIGQQHSGFGLFIAGPSKTADIEQSLVIGAHGARSLRVVLV